MGDKQWARGTGHGVEGTGHRAQGTRHRAQGAGRKALGIGRWAHPCPTFTNLSLPIASSWQYLCMSGRNTIVVCCRDEVSRQQVSDISSKFTHPTQINSTP